MLKALEFKKKGQSSCDIVLVEDNDYDAELVLSVLGRNNISAEVLRIRDGGNASDFFRMIASDTKQTKPKVVLLDYNMPKMSGIDVLRIIRSYPATSNLPVMMITGNERETSESFKLGISSFITKNSGLETFEKSLLGIQLYLNQFKVLILEDGITDSMLIEDALRQSKIQFTAKLVSDESAYLDALYSFKPDVIYSDFSIRNYDAIRAIRALKAANLNIPFILVTGTLSEEFASGCLSEGIDDYLLKSNFTRLPASLVNALRKKKTEEEKAKIQRALVKTNEELNTLFNNIDQVFFSIDVERDKMIHVSKACDKVYGYPAVNFMQDTHLWQRMIHHEDRENVLPFEHALKNGKTVHKEYRIIHCDKSTRWVSTKLIPTLDYSGKLVRIDGYTSDITEQKTAELKYNELNSLIYRIAHDLRGPVSSIGILSFSAQELARDEKMKIITNTIAEANSNMGQLLTGMLDLIKLVGVQVQKEKIGFNEMIRQILESITNLPERKGVQIKTRIETDGDFYSDKQSCYSLLYNLILNAIMYRRQIENSFVNITIASKNGMLNIKIEDNGIGIPDGLRNSIFEKFVRAHESTSGSGLGLFIVKNAVEKLRGTISVESKLNEGTTFTVKLPVTEPS